MAMAASAAADGSMDRMDATRVTHHVRAIVRTRTLACDTQREGSVCACLVHALSALEFPSIDRSHDGLVRGIRRVCDPLSSNPPSLSLSRYWYMYM